MEAVYEEVRENHRQSTGGVRRYREEGVPWTSEGGESGELLRQLEPILQVRIE